MTVRPRRRNTATTPDAGVRRGNAGAWENPPTVQRRLGRPIAGRRNGGAMLHKSWRSAGQTSATPGQSARRLVKCAQAGRDEFGRGGFARSESTGGKAVTTAQTGATLVLPIRSGTARRGGRKPAAHCSPPAAAAAAAAAVVQQAAPRAVGALRRHRVPQARPVAAQRAEGGLGGVGREGELRGQRLARFVSGEAAREE